MDLRGATCASPVRASPSPGAAGQGDRRVDATQGEEATTPTKRNKRKMSEPRKVTDFSVHSLCKDKDSASQRSSPPSSKRRRTNAVKSDKNGNIPKTKSGNDTESNITLNNSGDTQETNRIVHPAFAVRGFAMPMAVPMIPGYPMSGYQAFPGGVPVGGPVNSGATQAGSSSVPPSPTGSTASTESTKTTSNKRKSSSASHSVNIHSDSGKKRKNYKNMTRERRIEANARERSRVHLISAAFENLRRAVPSYSYNQRLSKLAILRIACSYIISLARLADPDLSHDSCNLSFSECVDLCTRTIQTEGRARRRH